MARDIQTCTDPKLALAPAQYTASANGLVIDRKGADSLCFDVFAGAVAAATTSNYLEFKLQYGNQSNLSDAVDVPLADLVINGTPGDAAGAALPRLNATGMAGTRVCRIGFRGHGKRYVRLVATETGIVDAFVSAVALRGHLETAPA